jgi:putative SOS response-associated peptidase YedK
VCNLYSLNKKRDMLARFFRVSHNRTVAFDPLSAIFPGHVAPVVRQTADGEREIVLMNWRFVLPQRDKAPRSGRQVRGSASDA